MIRQVEINLMFLFRKIDLMPNLKQGLLGNRAILGRIHVLRVVKKTVSDVSLSVSDHGHQSRRQKTPDER